MAKLTALLILLANFYCFCLSGQSNLKVNFNLDGIALTTHKVAEGETIFGISRIYNTDVSSIQFFNRGMDPSSISIDSTLLIPLDKEIFSSDKPNGKFLKLHYKIKAGDTFYSLGRKSGIAAKTLQSINQMGPSDLSVGKMILLGYYPLEEREISNTDPMAVNTSSLLEPPKEIETKPTNDDSFITSEGKSVLKDEMEELSYHEDRGIAIWKEEWKTTSGFYVLHRTAPINSIIEMENPMFNRKAFGKVSGRIPESLYSSDVILIVSDGLARHLGVLDERFFVKVRYLQPN